MPLWQAAQPLVTPVWLAFALAAGEFGEIGAIGPAEVGKAVAGWVAAALGDALFTTAVLGDIMIGDFAAGPIAFAFAALGLAVAVVVVVVVVAADAAAAGAAVVAAVVGAAGDFAAAAGAAAAGAAVVVAVVGAAADLAAAAGAVAAGVATAAAVAVVEHPDGELRCWPKLVVLVWQQPQSAVVLGWSPGFPCAPFVPWLVNDPL
jgi:hypothetical protein